MSVEMKKYIHIYIRKTWHKLLQTTCFIEVIFVNRDFLITKEIQKYIVHVMLRFKKINMLRFAVFFNTFSALLNNKLLSNIHRQLFPEVLPLDH